ncbi:MAG: lipoprotein [Betaproteobacteria bacterium]
MLSQHRILVRPLVLAISVAALTACGQPGPLYLPTDPAAAQRATLPQSLLKPAAPTASSPAP